MKEKIVFFKPETVIKLHKPVFYIPDEVLNNNGPYSEKAYFCVVTDEVTLSNYKYYAGIVADGDWINRKGERWIKIWVK